MGRDKSLDALVIRAHNQNHSGEHDLSVSPRQCPRCKSLVDDVRAVVIAHNQKLIDMGQSRLVK